APRDVVARAIDNELKRTGDDCAFLDMTHLDPEFLLKRFPNIKNAAIKYTAGQALDFLAPKGDQASADEINKQLEVNVAKGDQNLISGDAPLRQIRIRLVARL
ncbi:MAG: hypothetical protein CVU63_24210, partial [Deltaproteobacteria bacterium HGW-Deltaproteobacteria-20]